MSTSPFLEHLVQLLLASLQVALVLHVAHWHFHLNKVILTCPLATSSISPLQPPVRGGSGCRKSQRGQVGALCVKIIAGHRSGTRGRSRGSSQEERSRVKRKRSDQAGLRPVCAKLDGFEAGVTLHVGRLPHGFAHRRTGILADVGAAPGRVFCEKMATIVAQ